MMAPRQFWAEMRARLAAIEASPCAMMPPLSPVVHVADFAAVIAAGMAEGLCSEAIARRIVRRFRGAMVAQWEGR